MKRLRTIRSRQVRSLKLGIFPRVVFHGHSDELRLMVDRMGQPDEIADVMLFLSSPQAGYLPGQMGMWAEISRPGNQADYRFRSLPRSCRQGCGGAKSVFHLPLGQT